MTEKIQLNQLYLKFEFSLFCVMLTNETQKCVLAKVCYSRLLLLARWTLDDYEGIG